MGAKLFLRRKTSSFDLFFCLLTNSIFIKRQHMWIRHATLYKLFLSFPGFKTPSTNYLLLKFFDNPRAFWSLFWRSVSFNIDLDSGFFLDLELIGLGYRIKKVTPFLFRFFWGRANYVYLLTPSDVLVEYMPEDKAIFFFSVNAFSVNRVVSYLMLLRKLSVYRVAGFIRPGKIIRLNSGKQR